MNVDQIINLVSNVGFPVTMCVALFYYMVQEEKKHKEEINKLSETLQANTNVLTELCTLIKTLVK